MKEFMNISRAATCASGVILESCSPESVVAKRRDSVQKPYGMTSVWGGRTVNTSILSSPKVFVGDPFLLKKWKTTDTGTLRAGKPSSMTFIVKNNKTTPSVDSESPAGRQFKMTSCLISGRFPLSSPRNLVGDPLLPLPF